jgi:hypothetical protein
MIMGLTSKAHHPIIGIVMAQCTTDTGMQCALASVDLITTPTNDTTF